MKNIYLLSLLPIFLITFNGGGGGGPVKSTPTPIVRCSMKDGAQTVKVEITEVNRVYEDGYTLQDHHTKISLDVDGSEKNIYLYNNTEFDGI